ncbi:MAG: DegV family protein [Lachnospiraceae bacterium]|nr:DegV family protein [Candidatus Colinaster equi]
MGDYRIVVDSTADLPIEYIKEHNLSMMSLSYIVDGETFSGTTGKEIEPHDFYERVRGGMMPTTSQINPQQAVETFNEIGKETKQMLVISLSSGISGSYNSVRIGAEEYMEDNADSKIIVVDSLCASMGEGLLVYKAVENMEAGMSLEENALWIEQHKKNIIHCFTVDDLFHLYRGGRVKKSAAIVGSIVNLKPVLHVDNEGHLNNLFTVRGRKKSLKALVDYMEEHVGSYSGKNDIVFISHADAKEDAEYVAAEVKNRFGIENCMINYIDPTVGTHAGPGTVALFLLGDER